MYHVLIKHNNNKSFINLFVLNQVNIFVFWINNVSSKTLEKYFLIGNLCVRFFSFVISTKITEWKISRYFFGNSKCPWNYTLQLLHMKNLDILKSFSMSTENTFLVKKTKFIRLCIFINDKVYYEEKYFLRGWDEVRVFSFVF